MRTIIFRMFFTIAVTSAMAISASPKTTPQSVEFSFRAVEGPAVTSESLRGQVVVFGFGASWLPLTRTQMEGLKKIADQYAGRGVAVYWASTE